MLGFRGEGNATGVPDVLGCRSQVPVAGAGRRCAGA